MSALDWGKCACEKYFEHIESLLEKQQYNEALYFKEKITADAINESKRGRYIWEQIKKQHDSLCDLGMIDLHSDGTTKTRLISWLFEIIISHKDYSEKIPALPTLKTELEQLRAMLKALKTIDKNSALLENRATTQTQLYQNISFPFDKDIQEISPKQTIRYLEKATEAEIHCIEFIETTFKEQISHTGRDSAQHRYFIICLSKSFESTFHQSLRGTVANITNAIFKIEDGFVEKDISKILNQ